MTAFDRLEPTEVEVTPVLAVQYASHCACVPDKIKEAMGQAFGILMGAIEQQSLVLSGPPRAVYTSYTPEGMDFFVAFPIAASPANPQAGAPVTISTLPGGKTLRFTHRGPYGELMTTYNRITQYLQAKGLIQSEADWARYMPMWEEYLNDPATTPEAELLTHIFLPRG